MDIVSAASFVVLAPAIGTRPLAPSHYVHRPRAVPVEVVYRPLLAPIPRPPPPTDTSLAPTRFMVALPSGEIRPLRAPGRPPEPPPPSPVQPYHPLPVPPPVPLPRPRVAYPRPTIPMVAPLDVALPPWNATTVGLTATAGSGTTISATDADLLHGGPNAYITDFTLVSLDAGTF